MHTDIYTQRHIHTYKHRHTHVHKYTQRHRHTHTHTNTYIHTHRHTYIEAGIHTQRHRHTYTHIHTETHAHIYAGPGLHMHVHAYVCVHIHTSVCTYTQTCIHTNALRDSDSVLCQLSRQDLPAPQSQNPEPRWGAHDADQTNLRSSLGFFQTGPQRGLSVRSGCTKVKWKLSSACCPAVQLGGAQLSPGRSPGMCKEEETGERRAERGSGFEHPDHSP